MKEKIKKIFEWLFNNLIKLAEIGAIIWAVNGMLSGYRSCGIFSVFDYHFSPVLAYFFSAVLILYLLRKYESKN